MKRYLSCVFPCSRSRSRSQDKKGGSARLHLSPSHLPSRSPSRERSPDKKRSGGSRAKDSKSKPERVSDAVKKKEGRKTSHRSPPRSPTRERSPKPKAKAEPESKPEGASDAVKKKGGKKARFPSSDSGSSSPERECKDDAKDSRCVLPVCAYVLSACVFACVWCCRVTQEVS